LAGKCGESGDPRDCFSFDPNGKVHTDSGQAEKTYAFPPIKAGFIFDFNTVDITPHISIEAYEVHHFELEFGIANSRVFTSIGWQVIPIIKLAPVIWGGWNVKDKTYAYGIGINILDF